MKYKALFSMKNNKQLIECMFAANLLVTVLTLRTIYIIHRFG